MPAGDQTQCLGNGFFAMNWKVFRGHANPLWNLIGRVVAQAAELVLVALVRRAQSVVSHVIEHVNTHTAPNPPEEESRPYTRRATLQRLPDFRGSYKTPPCIMEAEILQDIYTTLSLENGSAGVLDRTVIPFHAL